MTTASAQVTETGGRRATTRHIPPKLALAVGMPADRPREGWQWAPLVSLARLESGHTPSRRHPEYWGGSIPWIGIADAKANHGKRIDDTLETTNELGIKNSSARVLPKDTVCLSRTASVGYVVVMGRPMATSQDFVNWVPSGELDPRFLKYLFIAEGDDLLRFASGAIHQTIYFPEAKAFHICLPSLAEQRRIVGLLDEAFAGVAAAKANAEKNLHNASALFESRLQSAFTQRGKGWVEKTLGELATFRNGVNYTKDSRGDRIKIVGVGNFQKHFSAPLDDLATVTIDGKLSERDSLKRGDILAVRSNGNVDLIGRCVLVGEVTERISHSGFTIRIRLSNASVLPKYVCYFMKSAGSRKLLTEGGVGTNIKSLNQGMLSALSIPFPPIAAQSVLIEQLESLSEETQRLVRIYERKSAGLEALRKSLLHQAFTGEL